MLLHFTGLYYLIVIIIILEKMGTGAPHLLELVLAIHKHQINYSRKVFVHDLSQKIGLNQ